MATWTKADGGLAIGLLVGALAEGPPESERCHLSASTVHRWLDQAGIKAQESVEGQLEGIADTKSAGGRPEVVYGLWAKLRGGGKRVVLMLTDSVTGRPENR